MAATYGKPKILRIICDTCELPWNEHEKLPQEPGSTLLDEAVPLTECIRLLRKKLSEMPGVR